MLSYYQKARYEAFWNNDAIDHCLMHISCAKPDENGKYVSSFFERKADMWFNPDGRTQQLRDALKYTQYYDGGHLSAFVNFGPGALSACIGGSFIPADGTVWFDRGPFIDLKDLPPMTLDYNSEMWRAIEGLTQRWCEGYNDDYTVSMSDLGGPLDILASLRDTETLATDLYDDPDGVIRASAIITERWIEAFDRLAKILFAHSDGMTSWLPIWSSKTYYPLQCDFSAFISPKMFERFVLPDLTRLTNHLDRSLYHWDGPGEIVHLDLLLAMPRLNAIQWVPGDGQPNCGDPVWFDLFHRIQAAGKGLIIGTGKEYVEGLLENLSTRGLFIQTGVRDEYEANKLIEMAKAYGVK